MKATGVVRKIDPLGRIVIPKEIRDTFDLSVDTPMEVFVNDGGDIILRAYRPGCVLCGDTEIKGFASGKALCRNCAEKASRLVTS